MNIVKRNNLTSSQNSDVQQQTGQTYMHLMVYENKIHIAKQIKLWL